VLEQPKRTIFYHLKTAFLFTKSDFKTVIFPQTVFILAFVFSQIGQTTTTLQQVAWRLPQALSWIWLHLLVENISNQRLPDSVVEDAINKPWRPIPAGRLTANEADGLLRLCVPLAMAMSLVLESFEPSTALMAFIWLYNDLGGSSVGPLQRNALNAAGLSCFGWGGVSVLLGQDSGDGILNGHAKPMMPPHLGTWLALLAAVITTTVHAQDFPDVEGDSARDRATLPLLYGETCSRWSLAILVVAWSFVCPAFWHVANPWVWLASVSLGCVMASLTILQRGVRTDGIVWKLWCLWMSVLYLLPLFRGLGA
jgi:4-hydroxybenzoate polyprenyltransferase